MFLKLVRSEKGPFVLALALLFANIPVWQSIVLAERGVLTVAFLDVGQGDAIFIESPNGNQVLIDAGSGRPVLRALGRVMPFYDHSIDLVIATHPDADHIGGFPEVLERFAIGAVMEPGVSSDTFTYQAFQASVGREGAREIFARRGQRVALGRSATLEILFPDRPPQAEWETNTASIVARLTYGESEFLFTGDSPIQVEKYLFGLDGRRLRSRVLKVGHHGSKTSSDPVFLAAVGPDYAVISAGRGNRYGHPHPSVLEALGRLGTRILSTADRGTIVFETDGERLSVLD
ncbi:MAG: MBL fold metallo-hydrolase [Candidatus Vogelbacteria bacterium]|nr:MBL fold metallo-hydrolase [Candidatus Vogelbacteria bacterium]